MLIDDDVTDNFIASRIISITGFSKEIVVTSNVREAMMYLRENETDQEQLPELIFLDINMPLYNGFDFLAEFETLGHHIKKRCKIIILSSSDNKPDIERILSIDSVIKFITKPISEQTLEEIHFKNA
ncbi:MAG: response regulator [Azospira oryzae]|nr:MAG: response regulator [Azospira oryzae]